MSIVKKIVSVIAKEEDGKSSVKVGDVREIVGIIADELAGEEGEAIYKDLVRLGKERAKKKK